ncbi:MAG: ATP-grasp domain-containing protein [archaeon]
MNSSYKKHCSFVDLSGETNVYLHEINTLPGFEEIIASVDGIEKYDRVTAIARKNDVVFLKSTPDYEYLKWLASVNMGSRNIIILDGEAGEVLPERVVKNGARQKMLGYIKQKKAELCPYYGGKKEMAASIHLGLSMYANTMAVEKYDSKVNFKNMCTSLGVPVLDGDFFNIRRGEKTLKKLLKKNMKETGIAIVRGEFGASGSTTLLFSNLDKNKINKILSSSEVNQNYIIEPYVEKASSPSSTWFVSKNKEIFHLRTSDQILVDGISHAGNKFPVDCNESQIDSYSFKIASRLCDEGFIGPFGIDYMQAKTGELYATECNPRVTGSMYPWEIVCQLETRHGKIKAATSKNMHLLQKQQDFLHVKKLLGNYLYNGTIANNKVFPFNVGPVAEGKFALVGFGESTEEVDLLFTEIEKRINESRF